MYKNKKVLAIIPARGGSKGLPGKNTRLLLNKPLIAWTIEQAKKSSYIDNIVVNTDSPYIASVAKRYGASVPFLRPKKLATGSSPVYLTILHTMKYFELRKQKYDMVILLECTSPIRYPGDIDAIIRKLADNRQAGSLTGVTEITAEHPQWAFKLKGAFLKKFVQKASGGLNLNRQLLAKAYLPNSIYASRWDSFKKYKTFYQPRTASYLLKPEQKVDINNEFDFHIAECVLRKYLKRMK